MSDTSAPAADVNAAEEPVDSKQTTTEDSSSKETKDANSTLTDQEQADKEIAQDLSNDEEADDTQDEDEADDTDETDDENQEEEDDESESDAQEHAKGAEARKQALQTEIRELVAKRNELRQEVEQTNSQAYRTETPEELVEQGLSQEEAENEALRQEMQMREFNTHVADLNANLNLEALQVMQDFPVFDPDSSDYDSDFSAKVRTLYEQAAQPKVDRRTGLVVQSNIAPYEFYKAFADTRTESGTQSRVEGQIEGQKAADKQLAAAETPSSTAPRTKKTDPFLAGLLKQED